MIAPLGWIGQGGLGGTSPLLWALILGVASLWLRWTVTTPRLRLAAIPLGLFALLLLFRALPPLSAPLEQIIFWVLAGLTIVAAGVAISSRSPVYMAVWFALSLLGTAGLFLLQGSQFLGVATIAVYAGAIVVVFLFVLMLAQPQGLTSYDRSSWAWFAAPLALIAGAVWIGMLWMITADIPPSAAAAIPGTPSVSQDQDHMARLGAELFARHLVSIEVIGTLLLAALVGAVAIVIHGRRATAASNADSTPEDASDQPVSDPSRERTSE